MEEINRLSGRSEMPEVSLRNAELWYSDSARIRYYVSTPLYYKYNLEDRKEEEMPEGIYVILYDKEGNEVGTLNAKYARKGADEDVWEARNEVVMQNSEGRKLETDLLYWDMENQKIYTDTYSKLTSGDQIIEGNEGFYSDQQLTSPIFKKVTGRVKFEE